MEIGEQTKKRVAINVCKACNYVVSDTGLCSYGCTNDGEMPRAPGTIIRRTYERVDTLVEQVEI